MSNLFIDNQIQFEFITTADQSPSVQMTYLMPSTNEKTSEAMHHSEGALSESLYLYKGLLETALTRGHKAHVLSVGLGCGYNEMLAIAYLMSLPSSETQSLPTTQNSKVSELYIESFENNAVLRETFAKWLLIPPAPNAIESPTPHELAPTAQSELENRLFANSTQILELVAKTFSLAADDLKIKMADLFKNKQWLLRGALSAETSFTRPFGVIFFDAFSSKTSPELWSEPFLDDFLAKTSAPQCALATYACMGRLNRALRRAGYELKKQPGFANKRESTWAFK